MGHIDIQWQAKKLQSTPTTQNLQELEATMKKVLLKKIQKNQKNNNKKKLFNLNYSKPNITVNNCFHL